MAFLKAASWGRLFFFFLSMICQSVEKLPVVICSLTTQSCFLLIILLYSMILILLQTDVLQMIYRSIKINSHSAHFFFKVTTSRKTTILCAVQTAKKWQTKKFFFHRVEKSVNELFRLGVDIFAPLATFRRKVKELYQLLINWTLVYDSWSAPVQTVDIDLIILFLFLP